MTRPAEDHRRATAERNVAAILDAAESLLGRRAQATIAAVAADAGVSRVTVYSHFATREALLEAVVRRTVEHASRALDEAEPERGPAMDALDRVLTAAWRELDRSPAIARAASEQLSAVAMVRSHDVARRRIAALVARGREEGSFRTDVPPDWLVTCFFSLAHACGDEVRAGRLDASEALAVLARTLRDVFAGEPS